MSDQEDLYKKDCITTYTGKYVNVFEPEPDMFCIEDIAHALAHQCRFAGHIYKFYSVAQHCLNCTYLIQNEYFKKSALMHDASEAYLLDIPSPIKKRLTDYNAIEDKLMHVIANKFKFDWPMHEAIKIIDKQMLELEWNILMLRNFDCELTTKSFYETEKEFISLFKFYDTKNT